MQNDKLVPRGKIAPRRGCLLQNTKKLKQLAQPGLRASQNERGEGKRQSCRYADQRMTRAFWKEYFEELLNRATTASTSFKPFLNILLSLALPQSYRKFLQALSCLRRNKAAGPDNIPVELLIHDGRPLQTRLFVFILRI